MTDRPLISVIVPTYNRVAFLDDCLDSLLMQTLPPAQIIVVDDGSTDGTPELLARYGDRIEVVRTANRGKPAAVNEGLEAVRGEYVWILDDDDVALPDALDRFVSPLLADPDAGFSYSPKYVCSTNAASDVGRVLYETSVPDQWHDGFLFALMMTCFLGGATVFVRKSVYDEVGRFDERLIRSQDYEMIIRIAWRYRGVRVPGEPTFYCRQHGGLRGNATDRFSVRQRTAKWEEYNRVIFRRLYDDLPLEAFLPVAASSEEAAEPERLALLGRIVVMSSKGLQEEAFDDLERLSGGRYSVAVTGRERSLCRQAARWLGPSTEETARALTILAGANESARPLTDILVKYIRIARLWRLLPRRTRSLFRPARGAFLRSRQSLGVPSA